MISLGSILEELGFEKFEHPLSSKPAYRMCFGPHEIQAAVLVNRWLQEGFMLSGIVNTGRAIGSIEAELPLEVGTKEEGLALLSYFLASQIPEQHKPPWLRIGERMKSNLPWARKVPRTSTR